MVFLTLSQKLNQWIGPLLLKHSIRARYRFGGGILQDQPYLDGLLLLPLAQKLVAMEARETMLTTDFDDHVHTKRVEILEKYLRPAMIPNERWSDVREWQFHSRILKFARAEFLNAKYGAHTAAAFSVYPSLKGSTQLKRRGLLSGNAASQNDKSGLPTTSSLAKAFDLKEWSMRKDLASANEKLKQIAESLGGQMIQLRGGALVFANIPDDAELSQLSLEEVIQLAGGHVMHCGPLNVVCNEMDIYQLWTKEYIEGLGDYLQRRCGDDTLILDVGAGDGLLAKFLRDYWEQRQDRKIAKPRGRIPKIVATDDGSWSIYNKARVERYSVQRALKQYADYRLIVLCSWMPMNQDWSKTFRDFNVEEYILIGEADDGQCGDNWLTWGNYAYLRDIGEDIEQSMNGARDSYTDAAVPKRPYESDGYKRQDLDGLAPYQFSRFDCSVSKFGKTVSFRKKS